MINITIKKYFHVISDFWNEYDKLDHKKLGIPNNIREDFKDIWLTKTWYDVLNYTDYYNLCELRNIFFNKLNVKHLTEPIYKQYATKYKKCDLFQWNITDYITSNRTMIYCTRNNFFIKLI